MVADRALAEVFAAVENEIVPLPVPLAPAVTVSHEGALLAAVQEQPDPVTVRPTDALSPSLGGDHDGDASAYVQPETACRKLATVAAVLFSVSALFCVDVPVT